MSAPRHAAALLTEARRRLSANAHAEPRDARLLLGHVLGLSEAQVLALGNEPLEEGVAEQVLELVGRRAGGEPYAYLVGEREFYGRPFHVDPRVLIPRPETELLVEAVLEADPAHNALVVDVGTGSGCLALTLAAERPDLRVVGVDVSLGALAVAALNRRRLGLEERVDLVAGDLLTALLPSCDVLVSNPPYVARGDDLAPEVREHEPSRALFATAEDEPDDALAIYRRLLAAAERLPSGALVAVEIGHGQARQILELTGTLRPRATRRDLAGIERVLEWLVP